MEGKDDTGLVGFEGQTFYCPECEAQLTLCLEEFGRKAVLHSERSKLAKAIELREEKIASLQADLVVLVKRREVMEADGQS